MYATFTYTYIKTAILSIFAKTYSGCNTIQVIFSITNPCMVGVS